MSLALLLCTFFVVAPRALAQGVVRDDFEGPETSLIHVGGDANYRIDSHVRVPNGAHTGQWCERLIVRGNNGTYVYVARDLPPARVIGELSPSVWVKADRPGLQLLVRVVLPRASDPRTGKPLTTLLRGASYNKVGVWQQLRLENLTLELDRQVRVLRAQFGRDVDAREAYVDRLLLNVYGGPGVTTVLVDDLEVAGAVAPPAPPSASPTGAAPPDGHAAPRDLPATWAGGAGVPKIERSGSLLLVDGKPFFPRAIEYQGEPPARLRAMGFNAVWISRTVPLDFLRDAAAAGLFVIAPPPPIAALESRSADGSSPIGSQFDPVLAWDLGGGLASAQLDVTRRWAKLVQSADARGRPIVCQATSELTAYTRPPIHLLLARRDVLGTSLQLPQYTQWLRQRSQLALPGTILWATIQTQPPAPLVEQAALLSRGPLSPIAFQESQLRTLVHATLAGGARGLYFLSSAPLDATDAATRRRAALLELMNLELDLIERWPATGSFTTTADSSDPQAGGAVIETDRSRLLLPMFTPPESQLVMGAVASTVVNYTVPGVPEEDDAYELSLVSFRPLDSKRVAGGTRVLLGELERDSLVVFTQDPQLIRGLHARLQDKRRRAADLARKIAADDQVSVEVVCQRLAALGHAIAATRALRTAAQNDLREFDGLLARGDLAGAYYRARHALAAVRLIQRAHFDDANSGATRACGDPLLASFETLEAHFRLVNELASAPRGPNTLLEGGCEDLQRMVAAGWKHFRHQQPNITTAVDLAPQAAHAGRTGLRMRAVSTDPDDKPGAIETPPMWVTTSPLQVERGQTLEIQGWVRITRPITGSVDGLLIIDSLTGEPMAQRISQPGDWQPFTIYRAVGRSGSLTLTFALSGLGEAWIDDLSIRTVSRGQANPPQQAQQIRLPRPPGAGS
jgi:hypothetical protein